VLGRELEQLLGSFDGIAELVQCVAELNAARWMPLHRVANLVARGVGDLFGEAARPKPGLEDAFDRTGMEGVVLRCMLDRGDGVVDRPADLVLMASESCSILTVDVGRTRAGQGWFHFGRRRGSSRAGLNRPEFVARPH
jgi:hypothetical protein